MNRFVQIGIGIFFLEIFLLPPSAKAEGVMNNWVDWNIEGQEKEGLEIQIETSPPTSAGQDSTPLPISTILTPLIPVFTPTSTVTMTETKTSFPTSIASMTPFPVLDASDITPSPNLGAGNSGRRLPSATPTPTPSQAGSENEIVVIAVVILAAVAGIFLLIRNRRMRAD
jgi:hypothetical protein